MRGSLVRSLRRAGAAAIRRLAPLATACARIVGTPLAHVFVRVLQRTRLKAGVAVHYHEGAERPGDPGSELVPAFGVELFGAQMRPRGRLSRLVPAWGLPPAVRPRRRGEPFPAAVTFDDNSSRHARLALPLLNRLAIPGTFYLLGAGIDEPRTFWWESLQRAYSRAVELEPALAASGSIHDAGARIRAMTPAERDELSLRLERIAGTAAGNGRMTAADVRALARNGMEIGFHTHEHHPLTQLDEGEWEHALNAGRERLAELAGSPLRTIAYPHGKADERVADAARVAGYSAGYTTRRCAVGAVSDPLLLGRYEASRASTGAFAIGVALTLLT